MAHPTDYASRDDIAKISGESKLPPGHYARILILNFIKQNSTWSIDSAYDYCMKYYKDHGATPRIFVECVSKYILGE